MSPLAAFKFGTKLNSIWFKIERKNVTTIIFQFNFKGNRNLYFAEWHDVIYQEISKFYRSIFAIKYPNFFLSVSILVVDNFISNSFLYWTQTGKAATIRRPTVRETGVPRQNGDQIESTPETHRDLSAIALRGLYGPLIGAPYMGGQSQI